MHRKRRAGRLVALTVVLAGAFFATASAAGAHTLLEDRAEAAAERYASFKQGGGYGSLIVEGTDGDEINLRVDRYDSGRCASRGPHRRLCPVEYEGKNYEDEDCRLGALSGETDADARDCFEKSRVTCDQLVSVTLRGPHLTTRRTRAAQTGPTPTFKNLIVTAGEITCRDSSSAPSAPAPPPTG